ncbi:glycosyltransferase family 9 protein [Sulfurimonas sp. HSL-1716]|uniref:glycosyltransferase family 9 protein n=1 Tax=Hydrocurvibacter sulfurireducens TaxID=3131937 RepID=UPI0031FA1F83
MNILVVRTDKLGDFITALPACKVLKKYDPRNRIIVCVAPLNESLAHACDFIDEVIIDDGRSSVFKLSQRFRAAKIDVSITLFSNTRVAFAQFLARIPKRIAPATKIAQIFYTQRVKQRRSEVKMAEFEYNLELARVLFPDIDLDFEKPLLRFDDALKVYEKFCKANSIEKETIAFHPGFGGSSDANWSVDEYIELVRTVLEKKSLQAVMTFGPDEQNLYDYCREKLKNEDVVFYISKEGLVNFAKLISNFKLFVSTSTGTYHLAALVGIPTMTFFADSLFASSARWKSVSDESLQKHYMIPHDKNKRAKMFEDVKKAITDVF